MYWEWCTLDWIISRPWDFHLETPSDLNTKFNAGFTEFYFGLNVQVWFGGGTEDIWFNLELFLYPMNVNRSRGVVAKSQRVVIRYMHLKKQKLETSLRWICLVSSRDWQDAWCTVVKSDLGQDRARQSPGNGKSSEYEMPGKRFLLLFLIRILIKMTKSIFFCNVSIYLKCDVSFKFKVPHYPSCTGTKGLHCVMCSFKRCIKFCRCSLNILDSTAGQRTPAGHLIISPSTTTQPFLCGLSSSYRATHCWERPKSTKWPLFDSPSLLSAQLF